MSTTPYEYLFRCRDDGTLSGAHVIRRDPVTGQLTHPEPVGENTDFPWPSALAELNHAAINAHVAGQVVYDAELEQTKKAFETLKGQYHDASQWIAAVRQAYTNDPTSLPAAVASLDKPAKDRLRKSLVAQLAALDS